jgi:hypothetical protein
MTPNVAVSEYPATPETTARKGEIMHQSLNLEAAKTNPSKFFDNPKEVLLHPDLSRKNKIDILRQWEVDARLMSVAEEENMTAGESSHLGAVVTALIALDDEKKRTDTETGSGPGKLGG